MRCSVTRDLVYCACFIVLTACQPSAPSAPTAAATPTPAPAAAPADSAGANLLDGSVVGPLDTFESLQKKYGTDKITKGYVPGAEGAMSQGWTLFPDDPKKRLFITLDDAGVNPVLLQVSDRRSQWEGRFGIHMGTTLTELVVLNAKPIQFSGFGWDYGGVISDWNHGLLDSLQKSGGVTLCAPTFPDQQYPPDYPLGKDQFSSTEPTAVQYPPVVCKFGFGLDKNALYP
jgi:hypothetical protein